jgi:hypothetical protein
VVLLVQVLCQLSKALFLGRQVLACTFSSTNNSLAGWNKFVPACQGIIPWQAGTTLPRNNSLEGWYKLLPAQQGVIPFQEGTSLYQLDEE